MEIKHECETSLLSVEIRGNKVIVYYDDRLTINAVLGYLASCMEFDVDNVVIELVPETEH